MAWGLDGRAWFIVLRVEKLIWLLRQGKHYSLPRIGNCRSGTCQDTRRATWQFTTKKIEPLLPATPFRLMAILRSMGNRRLAQPTTRLIATWRRFSFWKNGRLSTSSQD